MADLTADTAPALALLLILPALAFTQGSESSRSSAEASGENQHREHNNDKTTGAQQKFWVPTYHGTNPLGRRKISITTSEIETYDKSIDVSLSGVYKNRTKGKSKEEDTDSMPLLWSGDEIPTNKSEHMMVSMESNPISLLSESKSSKPSDSCEITEDTSSESSCNDLSNVKTKVKHENIPTSTPYLRKTAKKQIRKDKLPQNSETVTKNKYVEKEIKSQFFNELDKTTSDDPKLTPEYYKHLVKTATKNTKNKLGYTKIKPQTTSVFNEPSPEIIAVDINSKSIEKPHDDEIIFQTRHEQFAGVQGMEVDTKIKKSKQNTSKKNERVKKLSKQLTETFKYQANQGKESKIVLNITEKTTNSTMKIKVPEDSFTSFCDYSAWSDVLARNKTQRKLKKRKAKKTRIPSSYERSQENTKKWSGREIKKKADKLIKKESKPQRKNMKGSEQKIIHSPKRKGNEQSYEDDSYNDNEEDYDKSGKKIRMRTTGEKRHAYREVKDYLKKMDLKYGGRPGGETYKKKYKEKDYDQEKSRGKERRKGSDYGDRRRSRESWDNRERRGLGDRRKFGNGDYQGRRDRGFGRREDKGDRRSHYRDDTRGQEGRRNFRDRDGREFRDRKERDFRDRKERDFMGRRGRDSRDRRGKDFRDRRGRDFRDRRGRDSRERKGRDFRGRRESDRRRGRSRGKRDGRRGGSRRGSDR